jgi:hypothetical protein
MTKLPANFDWKNSPAHLELLGHFIKPRDITPVMNWQYLKDTIKEDTKDALERFIRDGALIPSGLEEGLDRVFTAAQLRKMLKECALKQTGSKAELVERLVDADRLAMEELIGRLKLMKCSPDAIALIERYEEQVQQEMDLAKQHSFVALLNNNPKDAYKIFASHQRKYAVQSFFSNHAYVIPELESILASHPRVLDTVTSSDLRSLQAAACMTKLWYGESAVDWLPDAFPTPLKSVQVAVNYLMRHAEIRHSISQVDEYAKRLKIVFDSSDIDSCHLCLALDSKEFDKDEFPDLPFENCTSETGCMCHVVPIYDFDSSSIEVSFNDYNEDDDFGGGSPVAKLKQLKEMLDNELITQAEYDKKKAEILSRL